MAVPVQAAAAATPVTDPEVAELKAALLDSFWGTDRGLTASSDARAEINELITQVEAGRMRPPWVECCSRHSLRRSGLCSNANQLRFPLPFSKHVCMPAVECSPPLQLEARNPTPEPNDARELLSGAWRLAYTSNSELIALLALGRLPLVTVGEVRAGPHAVLPQALPGAILLQFGSSLHAHMQSGCLSSRGPWKPCPSSYLLDLFAARRSPRPLTRWARRWRTGWSCRRRSGGALDQLGFALEGPPLNVALLPSGGSPRAQSSLLLAAAPQLSACLLCPCAARRR